MERIWYIILALGACVVALGLFLLGYSHIRYYRAKGKWLREFWISVAIVLAFLTSISCSNSKSTEIQLIQSQQSEAFSNLQEIWQKLTNTIQRTDTKIVEPEIEKLINQIQQSRKFSDSCRLVINALFSARIDHINASHVTCYMTLGGFEQRETLDNLESQYQLLAKAKQEGKIRQETYNKIREAISKDFELLKTGWGNPKPILEGPTKTAETPAITPLGWENRKPILEGLTVNEKNEVVDFIIELSGVEAKEQSKLEDTQEWKAIIEHWEVVSQLKWDQKTTDELGKIHKETEKRLIGLARLADKGLISIALAELISNDFKRVQEVKPINVTCYEPMPSSPKYDSWLRLQARIPLLEKAVITGKINQWAYQKIVLKIKQDLETLGSNTLNDKNFDTWYKKSNNITDEQIEAIKKKAHELIEKIEQDGNYK